MQLSAKPMHRYSPSGSTCTTWFVEWAGYDEPYCVVSCLTSMSQRAHSRAHRTSHITPVPDGHMDTLLPGMMCKLPRRCWGVKTYVFAGQATSAR